jgi:hypothetical protein
MTRDICKLAYFSHNNLRNSSFYQHSGLNGVMGQVRLKVFLSDFEGNCLGSNVPEATYGSLDSEDITKTVGR